MRSLLPLLAITALSLYALFAFAGEVAPDALGCVIDDITGNYRCETGPLAGREFISQQEAEATLKLEQEKKSKDKEDEAFAATYSVPLKLISWNLSTVGTKRFEYDRIAGVLGEADFVILQDVEFTASGETSLTVIAEMMSRQLNQRICKAWFKNNSGGRGRHAFLWKDKVVSYVGKNGAVEDRCPDAPVVIRVDGKKIDPNEPLMATFFLKTRRQMFNAVSVQMDQKPRKTELLSIFTKLAKLPWPAVVAGSFKTGAGDKALQETAKPHFKPAITRSGSGTANIWVKNLNVIRAEAVDLEDRFRELSAKDVAAMVAKNPPLLSELSFSAQEADALRTQVVKRKKAAAKLAKSERRLREKSAIAEKPAQKILPIHDDLEGEAE